MNFEEALELKNNTNPNNHIMEGFIPLIFVAPKHPNDFANYMQEFQVDPKSDGRAKIFDKHNSYDVIAFYNLTLNGFIGKSITGQ